VAEPFEVDPRERVDEFLARSELGPARVAPLAGDASNRLYFRVSFPSGETRILALHPSPFVPEEMPFLEVAGLFRRIEIPVPEVYRVEGALGILLIEDLGDNLLQDEASSCEPERKRELYREAIGILMRLQSRARELESDEYLPFRIAFDAEKFHQELTFFKVHFLEGLRGRELSPGDESELDGSFRELAEELALQPRALCHRDYHSRNLIVGDRLTVIDFQDARMGPRCYDLVSLLNDSYVARDDALVADMKELFARELSADVEAEYDVAALQRNLKALGTFGFQISSRGNDVYLRYIDHTLGLVRENLARNRRWSRLERTLAQYLPEE
jgi:hypothetical protein